MAVDRALLNNFLQLNNFPEFEPFRKWLREQREFWRDALEQQKDPDVLRQAQGRAQAYKEILTVLSTAQAVAEKERGKPQDPRGGIPFVM